MAENEIVRLCATDIPVGPGYTMYETDRASVLMLVADNPSDDPLPAAQRQAQLMEYLSKKAKYEQLAKRRKQR